jgi:uncharacterized protein (TIGR02996 family)
MQLDPTLLRGVLAAPDEDGPRQVLADWLLDREDPRGQLIADQIVLARMPETDPAWPALFLRAERAVARALPGLMEPLLERQRAEGLRWHDWKPVVRRGFLEQLALPAGSSLLDWVLQWTPLRLAHARTAEIVQRLADRGVPGLRVQMGPISPSQLAGLPLERFVDLYLDETQMGTRGARVLADKLAGRPVRTLSLRGANVRDSGLAALLDSGALEAVETVDLTANLLGPPSLDRLLARRSDRPVRLALTGNSRLGPELDRVLDWRPLRALELRSALSGEALDRALASPALRGLESLSLASCTDLDAARAAKLAEIPFTRLTRLDLGNTRIGAKGALALARSPHLQHLVSLDLSTCQLEDEGLESLLSSPHLGRLVELDVSKCRLTDQGARALARWPRLPGMARLELSLNGRIEDEGLQALMDVEGFQPLELGLVDLPRDRPMWDRLVERFGSAVRPS